MFETLIDERIEWVADDGPEADVVLYCRGLLSRNLADFPFPARCSYDERHAVEERVIQAVASTGRFGDYCSLEAIEPDEGWFLAERALVSVPMLQDEGPRGLFVGSGQSTSIMVNEGDHICMQALVAGMRPQDVWAHLNSLDDALAAVLDFAYDDQLGYLTSSLQTVGTGFSIEAVMHLPALHSAGRIQEVEKRVREDRHQLEGVFGPLAEGVGDLYRLRSATALGRSEEEEVFRLRTASLAVIQEERSNRQMLLTDARASVEDRVGRALGTARGAHLLGFEEAVALISSIRLGVSLGLVKGHTPQNLNELMIAAHPIHIAMRLGHSCDALAENAERGDLFRSCFSE